MPKKKNNLNHTQSSDQTLERNSLVVEFESVVMRQKNQQLSVSFGTRHSQDPCRDLF